MENELTLLAPAKINVFLEVLAKRSDGYHDIRSVVVPISLCDTVTFARTDGEIESTFENDGLPEEHVACLRSAPEDLVIRAASLLRDSVGYSGGARIHVKKSIPIGGGLGGGSADAAATLRGLNGLWGIDLPDEELRSLSVALGSDVAAMLARCPVLVSGMGERVEELPADPCMGENGWWTVVVNPRFAVSTRDSYERYSSVLTSADGQLQSMVSALKDGSIDMAASNLFNSLQVSVFAKYPLLSMITDRLIEAGALGAILCGSGASIFGLASSEAKAYGIRDAICGDVGPALWARVARILPDSVTVAHGPLEAIV